MRAAFSMWCRDWAEKNKAQLVSARILLMNPKSTVIPALKWISTSLAVHLYIIHSRAHYRGLSKTQSNLWKSNRAGSAALCSEAQIERNAAKREEFTQRTAVTLREAETSCWRPATCCCFFFFFLLSVFKLGSSTFSLCLIFALRGAVPSSVRRGKQAAFVLGLGLFGSELIVNGGQVQGR